MTQALISRLILHLPAQSGAPDVQALAKFDLPVQVFAGFAMASVAPVDTADWIDVFPGTAAQLQSDKISSRIASDTLVHNRWQWDGTALTLRSDVLGLKPLYRARDAQGGSWFASCINDLLSINPSWAQPIDRLGLHSLFIGRACWGTRTVHEKIARVATGTQLHWSAATGLAENRARRWRMAEADTSLNFEAATADMRRTLVAGINAWMAGDTADAQALSGGYDSRLLAALSPTQIPAVTYGSAKMRETRQARAVAKLLALQQIFVPLPTDVVFDQLNRGTQLFESNFDLSLLQTAPLTFVLPPGSVWLHGYPGDVIAGAFTTRMRPDDFTSHIAVAMAIVRSYAFQGVDAKAVFGFEFDDHALINDVAADLDHSVSPLAAYHLWCWESHLRRYTAGILSVMGDTMDVRLPYVWKAYIDLWAKVPLHGLQNRAWFKRWFAQEFPVLAAIAHPDDIQLSLLQRLMRRPSGASDYIYDGPNLVSPRHGAMAEAQIAKQRDALATVLGLTLQPGYENALCDTRYRKAQSRRLLLGLVDYAWALKSAW